MSKFTCAAECREQALVTYLHKANCRFLFGPHVDVLTLSTSTSPETYQAIAVKLDYQGGPTAQVLLTGETKKQTLGSALSSLHDLAARAMTGHLVRYGLCVPCYPTTWTSTGKEAMCVPLGDAWKMPPAAPVTGAVPSPVRDTSEVGEVEKASEPLRERENPDEAPISSKTPEVPEDDVDKPQDELKAEEERHEDLRNEEEVAVGVPSWEEETKPDLCEEVLEKEVHVEEQITAPEEVPVEAAPEEPCSPSCQCWMNGPAEEAPIEEPPVAEDPFSDGAEEAMPNEIAVVEEMPGKPWPADPEEVPAPEPESEPEPAPEEVVPAEIFEGEEKLMPAEDAQAENELAPEAGPEVAPEEAPEPVVDVFAFQEPDSDRTCTSGSTYGFLPSNHWGRRGKKNKKKKTSIYYSPLNHVLSESEEAPFPEYTEGKPSSLSPAEDENTSLGKPIETLTVDNCADDEWNYTVRKLKKKKKVKRVRIAECSPLVSEPSSAVEAPAEEVVAIETMNDTGPATDSEGTLPQAAASSEDPELTDEAVNDEADESNSNAHLRSWPEESSNSSPAETYAAMLKIEYNGERKVWFVLPEATKSAIFAQAVDYVRETGVHVSDPGWESNFFLGSLSVVDDAGDLEDLTPFNRDDLRHLFLEKGSVIDRKFVVRLTEISSKTL